MHQSPARCGARPKVGFGVGSFLTLALALVAVLLLGLLQPTPAGAQTPEASDYVARINALRSSVGVGAVGVDGELTGLAQGCAERIAADGALVHTGNLAAGITSRWTKLGENIGTGQTNGSIWTAFVHSAQHYGNLVDPAFNRVGIGVAYAGGSQWTCHRFMAASGGGSQPAAARPPAAASSPSAPRAPRITPPAPPAPAALPLLVSPRPMPGPPPPADSARVSAVLQALHVLTDVAPVSGTTDVDAARVSAVLEAVRLLSSTSRPGAPPGAT